MNSPKRSEIRCSGKSEHFLPHMWHPSRFTKNNWKPVIWMSVDYQREWMYLYFLSYLQRRNCTNSIIYCHFQRRSCTNSIIYSICHFQSSSCTMLDRSRHWSRRWSHRSLKLWTWWSIITVQVRDFTLASTTLWQRFPSTTAGQGWRRIFKIM